MDTSDPEIRFDRLGICNHCHNAERLLAKKASTSSDSVKALSVTIDQIKSEGASKHYDCILGLSGGVDSSYLALTAYKLGLRPLVVHVDAGWNSELAVGNIEAVIKYCDFDLHTHVVNWEDMRNLQISYLKSGIANQDVPQDHIFFATLYHFAAKNKFRYLLTGSNLATESVNPAAWHGDAMDAINIKAIHKIYGQKKLKDYKTLSFLDYYLWYPFFKGIRTIPLLNYIDYNKAKAVKELSASTGFKPYNRKHGESFFTKVFQNYFLPTKFGYDKRRPHFSSLILSGQMTKREAQKNLEEDFYNPEELELDIVYFCKKLNITREEFEGFIKSDKRYYNEFPNWDLQYKAMKFCQGLIKRFSGKELKIYK